jgi:hypothetical protein
MQARARTSRGSCSVAAHRRKTSWPSLTEPVAEVADPQQCPVDGCSPPPDSAPVRFPVGPGRARRCFVVLVGLALSGGSRRRSRGHRAACCFRVRQPAPSSPPGGTSAGTGRDRRPSPASRFGRFGVDSGAADLKHGQIQGHGLCCRLDSCHLLGGHRSQLSAARTLGGGLSQLQDTAGRRDVLALKSGNPDIAPERQGNHVNGSRTRSPRQGARPKFIRRAGRLERRVISAARRQQSLRWLPRRPPLGTG